jgi:hypothetical protein
MGPECVCGRGVIGDGGTRVAGVSAGVDGPEDEGDGLSTTHMRCERVATSFATVWASVLYGSTWKTGNESLPSLTPRSERMTEMKWMQEDRRSGSDVDFVRSYQAVSCWRYFMQGEVAYFNVHLRDVPDDIVLRVQDRQR